MSSGQLPSKQYPDIRDVYERFSALTSLSPELGGSLLVYIGLDRSGIALAIAANIAGATSLGVEPELVRAKVSIRSGACDFLVNTLDEALRILKNEIRKKKAVAVVLVGALPGVVGEMVERGVQPDVVAGDAPGMETLIVRGARRLGAAPGGGVAVAWRVEREPLRWLPTVDRVAAGGLDPASAETAARRRWLEAAPRYLGRELAGQRYLRMSATEAEAFVATVRREVESGGIAVAVTVTRDGNQMVITP
jgi:Urocanase Rossmann-like domain